jgi:uncharacterized phage-associated protein
MPYEARKICNFILTDFDIQKYDLSNLRLNKLLFLIHGWSLVRFDDGLVKNHFEAWRLGPVIRVVYNTFKGFEYKPITLLASHLDYAYGTVRTIPYEDISDKHRNFIVNIVNFYAPRTTNELVALLHQPGGPWDVTVRSFEAGSRINARIPEDLIRAHFQNLAGDKAHH